MTRPVVMLTGAQGQLGYELQRALRNSSVVHALDRSQLDLADADAIVAAVRRIRPDLIVNAAAYTAVDQAESHPDDAERINAIAPRILAEEAKRMGALVIHYSTDYVFDGTATAPYAETAETNPLSVYGRTKRDGENAVTSLAPHHLVFRTSWVYGTRGKNFLLTMQRLGREREELRVVADQKGTPNWSRDLAQATADIIGNGLSLAREKSGLYHLSSGGEASWFDFASAIIGHLQKTQPTRHVRVLPIATPDYPLPAPRPAYAVLDTRRFERTFGFSLPDWRLALEECLASRE
jgi:dTDP-4-dehydrorhamnose reductase